MLIYQQIMNKLIWEIKAGKYPAGSPLPAERELAARFGASQKSIHNAMLQLVRRGYVEQRHGSGNYVRSVHPGRNCGSIGIIMNCSRKRSADAFLNDRYFFRNISEINRVARSRGVGTELFLYDSEAPLNEEMFDHCGAACFINTLFTATPELERMIREHHFQMISTVTSFHLERYQATFSSPCVVVDYLSGLREAFKYYAGRKLYFLAQTRSGVHNFKLYQNTAKECRTVFSGSMIYEGNGKLQAYSAERQQFMYDGVMRLPSGSAVFSDGTFHLRELCAKMQESAEGREKLNSLRFSVVGVPDEEPELNTLTNLSWIVYDCEQLSAAATELLIDSWQNQIPLEQQTLVPAHFQPDKLEVQ